MSLSFIWSKHSETQSSFGVHLMPIQSPCAARVRCLLGVPLKSLRLASEVLLRSILSLKSLQDLLAVSRTSPPVAFASRREAWSYARCWASRWAWPLKLSAWPDRLWRCCCCLSISDRWGGEGGRGQRDLQVNPGFCTPFRLLKRYVGLSSCWI